MMRFVLLLSSILSLTASCAASAASGGDPDYHVVKSIRIGGAGGWDYLEPDPVGRRLYVSHGQHVVVIDMDTLEVVGDVPDSPGMGGVSFSRELNRGFTANGDEDAIGVFELDTLKPLAKWKATGRRPNQIACEAVTQRLFSFNSNGRNVTVFDARSGSVLATLEVDGRTEFYAMDGKGMIYDSLQDKATIIAIDAKALKVVGTYSLAPHSQPAGTSIDPQTRRIFVACRSKSLLVVDADSGKILATFPIDGGNDAVKFDPGLKLAFASNGEGSLAIVREKSANNFLQLRTVKTEPGARTMAVDTKTHRIFIPSADFSPLPAPTPDKPAPRREMLPGSFHVLVLEP